jgi:hypothetical protein
LVRQTPFNISAADIQLHGLGEAYTQGLNDGTELGNVVGVAIDKLELMMHYSATTFMNGK